MERTSSHTPVLVATNAIHIVQRVRFRSHQVPVLPRMRQCIGGHFLSHLEAKRRRQSITKPRLGVAEPLCEGIHSKLVRQHGLLPLRSHPKSASKDQVVPQRIFLAHSRTVETGRADAIECRNVRTDRPAHNRQYALAGRLEIKRTSCRNGDAPGQAQQLPAWQPPHRDRHHGAVGAWRLPLETMLGPHLGHTWATERGDFA